MTEDTESQQSHTESPFGPVGGALPERCRCGSPRHATHANRCANGHPWVGTAGPALVVGARSSVFWDEHAQARREIAAAVLRDAGHDESDAPETLKFAADSIAQAWLVQQSAFLRLAEARGPLSSVGRTRRAFVVWQQATDRLERFIRLVGLERKARPIVDLAQAFAQQERDRS